MRTRLGSWFLSGTILLMACVVSSPALRAGPSITHFTPLAVKPGTKTVVTFSGTELQSVSSLWLSCGGTWRRIEGTNKETVSFEVNCPAEARGIEAVQLSGAEGASNYLLLMVDALTTERGKEQQHSRTNAYRLKIPGAVDETVQAETVDYFAFEAAAGEKLSIEAIAHRIGSEMDPVLRVLDADGKELLVCDDEPGVWRDARFVFTSPGAGEYILAVHDAAYGGGNGFYYRLRVTHEPLIWYTYPLIDSAEPGARFELLGTGLPSEASGSPANPVGWARFSVRPEMVELEPNDVAREAQAVSLPVTVNGRIDRPNDVDCFRFSAGKGEKVLCQSATRSLGSPCDLVLAIKTPEGKTLAQSDSNLPSDAAVTNRFAEAGEYLLEVRELSGNAVPGVPYQIRMKQFAGGFELLADENRFEAAPGSTVSIKVKCVRHDFDGSLRFEMLPRIEGVTLEKAELPRDKNEVELKVTLSEQLPAGFLTHFKVLGMGPSGSSGLVSTRAALQKEFPLMLMAPAALDDLFSIALKAQ